MINQYVYVPAGMSGDAKDILAMRDEMQQLWEGRNEEEQCKIALLYYQLCAASGVPLSGDLLELSPLTRGRANGRRNSGSPRLAPPPSVGIEHQ